MTLDKIKGAFKNVALKSEPTEDIESSSDYKDESFRNLAIMGHIIYRGYTMGDYNYINRVGDLVEFMLGFDYFKSLLKGTDAINLDNIEDLSFNDSVIVLLVMCAKTYDELSLRRSIIARIITDPEKVSFDDINICQSLTEKHSTHIAIQMRKRGYTFDPFKEEGK